MDGEHKDLRRLVSALSAPSAVKNLPRQTLLKYKALGNLVTWPFSAHTLSTYHRTWETGLEVAARAAIADPAFFWSQVSKFQRFQGFSAWPFTTTLPKP